MTTIVDGSSGGTAVTDTSIVGYVPSGVVFPYAGSTAPSGFLFAAGQTVSRTTYAALFTALGTTYGAGDGSTTFGLPDLRGRAVFGRDDMGGTAQNRITNAVSGITGTTLGASGGNQNMPQHYHSYLVGGVPANGVNVRGTSGDGTNTGYVNTENAGSGASANMPPTLIINYIIKT